MRALHLTYQKFKQYGCVLDIYIQINVFEKLMHEQLET